MIETMYKWFGKMPVIGQPITLSYIGYRVKNAVTKHQDKKLDPTTAQLAGKELDDFINDQAHSIFNDEIQPLISEHNIPSIATDPLKNKAINEFSNVLRKNIEKKVTTKTN
jgi:hypothetical protein